MSKKVKQILEVYKEVRRIVTYYAENDYEVNDDIFDSIVNKAFKIVANKYKVTEPTIRAVSTTKGLNKKTNEIKQIMKDYMINKSDYFKEIVLDNLTKYDNLSNIEFELKRIR